MQVRDQNPKLAKQSRVLKVSMDNVYDFAVTPEVDKKTEGVSFRFMPDMSQVQKALEVGSMPATRACIMHSPHPTLPVASDQQALF